ncbi:POTRA domain-containing protein [Bizionia myxarmorum]|uniref:POTRA domain-containing protein n=1 Tax=Bizionia myxarmorum TaxID=291186 RepID=A0A5D0RFK6_9FLAO|nr:POTRA domain-containing protein [Bizionia myxarmorum]TYB79344.1 hypothetical protein ES674_06105 [Bizionia myxarmorum]
MAQNFYLKIEDSISKQPNVLDSINYFKRHSDYSALKQEVDSVKSKLYKLGYLDAHWNNLEKENDSVFHVAATLGQPYKNIRIYYDTKKLPPTALRQLRIHDSNTYFTLPFKEVEQTLKFINQKISDQGFPFNTAQLQNITKADNHNLTANLIISGQDSKRYVDKILVKGYEKFPKSYLKYYLKLKTGKTINLSEVKQQTNLLQELPFANQIKEPEILFSKDSTILYVYIEKTKSNTFDGFLGFGTNEETSKLELTGYLNLELTNNLNYGESLSLAYRSDESEQKSFNAQIKLPYLFNSPIGTELELDIFKKDSSFTTAYQAAKVTYQLNSKNQFSLGLKSIKSNNLLSTANLNPFIKDYQSTFYNIGYQFINRLKNERLFKRNAQILFETGLGNRTIKTTKDRQVQYYLNAFKIFNLNVTNSIYLKTASFGLFSNSYLENELSRFGGINSIRGFEENSLNATFYTLLATEYRYALSPILYIHSIIDIAYFENQIIDQKEKLYSFGFGFGLETKAGLLRFNYANGKSENQTFQFSNSKIHLSLSALF